MSAVHFDQLIVNATVSRGVMYLSVLLSGWTTHPHWRLGVYGLGIYYFNRNMHCSPNRKAQIVEIWDWKWNIVSTSKSTNLLHKFIFVVNKSLRKLCIILAKFIASGGFRVLQPPPTGSVIDPGCIILFVEFRKIS